MFHVKQFENTIYQEFKTCYCKSQGVFIFDFDKRSQKRKNLNIGLITYFTA